MCHGVVALQVQVLLGHGVLALCCDVDRLLFCLMGHGLPSLFSPPILFEIWWVNKVVAPL